MILWSVVETDAVFQSSADASEPPALQEVQRGDALMLVEPLERGTARIVRLISPDPNHYLRADLAPGSIIRW